VSATDSTAWRLQSAGDALAAALGSQDPPASGGDLAWQQDQVRGAYEDAAHLADQPKGW
jgi:hypothetical protein